MRSCTVADNVVLIKNTHGWSGSGMKPERVVYLLKHSENNYARFKHSIKIPNTILVYNT